LNRVPAIDKLFGALSALPYSGGRLTWPAVLVAWAGVSPTDSTVARSLNDEQVWPGFERDRALAYLKSSPGEQYAHYQTVYSVKPTDLLLESEAEAIRAGGSVVTEEHLTKVLRRKATELTPLGLNVDLLAEHSGSFESPFAPLKSRLVKLREDLSPDKERDQNYLADLASFRRRAMHLLNESFGSGTDLPTAFDQARHTGSVGAFVNLVNAEFTRYDRILGEAEERFVQAQLHQERGAVAGSPATAPSESMADLRALIRTAASPEVVSFLNEAVRCLEIGALRATAIMAWAGAVSELHDAATEYGLKEFEQAARTINPKAHGLAKKDDLQYFDDELLIRSMEKIGFINRTQAGLLLQQLKRRNAYAHPSGVEPSPEEVRALIAELTRIVFSRVR